MCNIYFKFCTTFSKRLKIDRDAAVYLKPEF